MNYLDILRAQLPQDEGRRPFPYRDTVGKITIGVGRNLSDDGLATDEIELLLANDILAAQRTAIDLIPNFESLSDVRKAVVMNMAFNLGEARFAGFHKTLQAIIDGRWDEAADNMLASVWANQVGVRARRLANMMRSDSL